MAIFFARQVRLLVYLLMALTVAFAGIVNASGDGKAVAKVVSIEINGTINPASDDYLRTSLAHAKNSGARLFIIRLNTPGGLLTSMKSMVESLLQAPVPTVVYVSPSGAGATSAGAFITMAANFAVMAPGTTIGAAHPVSGGGEEIGKDMKEKIENFTVSMIQAIAEQRGRNKEWAEKAVRESVSITDREAKEKKVIDFIARDQSDLFSQLEGKKVSVLGEEITLSGLSDVVEEKIPMTFRQTVVNFLSDPNLALLIGMAAMLGLGIELYNPGLIVPGIVGIICLVLSLTATQVLPINYGGVALLLLGAIFFIVELKAPSFGIWGVAGIVCFVLGSIYVIDTDLVWSVEGFSIDKVLIGSLAGGVGVVFLIMTLLLLRDSGRKITTGKEGLIGKIAIANTDFVSAGGIAGGAGKVTVMGEIWRASLADGEEGSVKKGQELEVIALAEPLTLIVKHTKSMA